MTVLLIVLVLFLVLAALTLWSLLRILAWADRVDDQPAESEEPQP